MRARLRRASDGEYHFGGFVGTQSIRDDSARVHKWVAARADIGRFAADHRL